MFELLGPGLRPGRPRPAAGAGQLRPGRPSSPPPPPGGPTNLAGPAGAIVSDVLLQAFGWAGAAAGLALPAWAWRLGEASWPRAVPGAAGGAAGGVAAVGRGAGAAAGARGAGGRIAGRCRAPAGSPAGFVGSAPGGGRTPKAAPAPSASGPRRHRAGGAGAGGWRSRRSVLSPGEWLRLGRAARAGAGGVARVGAAGPVARRRSWRAVPPACSAASGRASPACSASAAAARPAPLRRIYLATVLRAADAACRVAPRGPRG